MVRDDTNDPAAFHARFLLNQDFDVLVSMSIEVNDTGGLTPSLSYMKAFSPLTLFTFSSGPGPAGGLHPAAQTSATQGALSGRTVIVGASPAASRPGADGPDCRRRY
jgi:hypothetical protein